LAREVNYMPVKKAAARAALHGDIVLNFAPSWPMRLPRPQFHDIEVAFGSKACPCFHQLAALFQCIATA
jgi:hypothetical protein